jgi:hypothetical protein
LARQLYIEAIKAGFGADVDYAQIIKTYEAEPIGPGRYSPPKVASVERTGISGNPVSVRPARHVPSGAT